MQASTRAVATAVLAAVMAVAGFVVAEVAALSSGAVLAGLAALLAVAFASGWPVLMGLPVRIGSTIVVGLAGLGAVAVVFRTDDEPFLRNLPVVFAGAVLAAFLAELSRRDGRPGLVESVSGTVTGALIATATAGWVAAARTPDGERLVVVGALALALSSALAAVPLRSWAAGGLTAGGGLLAGLVGAVVLPGIGPVAGALLGLAVGVLVAALHALFDPLPALRRVVAAMAALVLPVAVTGILVYGVGRVLVA